MSLFSSYDGAASLDRSTLSFSLPGKPELTIEFSPEDVANMEIKRQEDFVSQLEQTLTNAKIKNKTWLLLLSRDIVFNHVSLNEAGTKNFLDSLPFSAEEIISKTILRQDNLFVTYATNRNFYSLVVTAIKKVGGNIFAVIPEDLKDSPAYQNFNFLR